MSAASSSTTNARFDDLVLDSDTDAKSNVNRNYFGIDDNAEFPQEYIDEFKKAIALVAKDENGTITYVELGNVLRKLGREHSDDELKEMIRKAEKSGDNTGIIDFAEFLELLATEMGDTEHIKTLEKAFDVFDKNDDGFISIAEFKHVLKNIDPKFTEEQIATFIRKADTKNNGLIDCAGFINSIISSV